MQPQHHPKPEDIYPQPQSHQPMVTQAPASGMPAAVMPPSAAPPGAASTPSLAPNFDNNQSVPVVKVLSVRGVEYAMMTIALWITATALAWVLINLINGSKGFDYLVVPISVLVICLPVFGLLFIRLKKAELANPALRLESSKRRLSQWTQILAFIAVIINAIVFVYQVLQHFGSDSKTSIPKALADLGVVLVIAGGLLFYYWRDEHKALKG